MSSTMQLTVAVTAPDEDGDPCEIEVVAEVEYEYSPASRGYRDSMGVPEEPDEPSDCEILAVVDDDHIDWLPTMTESQIDDLREIICSRIENPEY